MSTEERDWDLAAAEYVLRVSADEERTVFDRLYQDDEDWVARVHRWESRLNPLHASTAPVTAPKRVLTDVIARINSEQPATAPITELQDSASTEQRLGERADEPLRTDAARTVTPSASPSGPTEPRSSFSVTTTVEQWKTRARYWQLATIMAIAALAGVVVLGPDYIGRQYAQPDIGRTVAVLQSEEKQPLWTVAYVPSSDNDATGRVSITVVGEPQLTVEQDHQLWMVLPEGAGVESVGIVPNATGESATFELPIQIDEAAEFAISLEPLGGVPGPAHGPVVTRAFIVKSRRPGTEI